MSRYAENSVSEVDPRLENKNTEIPSKLENPYIVSEALKSTTLSSGNKVPLCIRAYNLKLP